VTKHGSKIGRRVTNSTGHDSQSNASSSVFSSEERGRDSITSASSYGGGKGKREGDRMREEKMTTLEVSTTQSLTPTRIAVFLS
jgi:hypothetical protein